MKASESAGSADETSKYEHKFENLSILHLMSVVGLLHHQQSPAMIGEKQQLVTDAFD